MKWLITSRPLREPRPGARLVRLVIAEAGARVSESLLAPDGDGSEDTVVVRQSDGELPAELARRTIARIAVIERSGGAVRRAIMVVAARHDEQSMASRHLLARALLMHAHVLQIDSAEIVLVVDANAEAALRHGLLGLVELLVGAPGSSAVPIRIQFRSPAEPSRPPPRKSGFLPRSTVHHEVEAAEVLPDKSTTLFGRRATASR